MAVSLKTSLWAALLSISLGGCVSGNIDPSPIADSRSAPAARSDSSGFAATVNRNIAAAAMQSSAASSDYQIGPEDLLQLPREGNAKRHVTS